MSTARPSPLEVDDCDDAWWFFDRPLVLVKDMEALFNDEAVLEICEAIKVEIPDDLSSLRNGLAYAAGQYVSNRLRDTFKRFSEKRKYLSDLHQSIEHVLHLFERLDFRNWFELVWWAAHGHDMLSKGLIKLDPADQLANEYAYILKSRKRFEPTVRDLNYKNLYDWLFAVECAVYYLEFENKRGRPNSTSDLDFYVMELADLYEELVGTAPRRSYDASKSRPSGPFFRFVRLNLDAVEPGNDRSDSALGSSIKRVLAHKKRLHRPRCRTHRRRKGR